MKLCGLYAVPDVRPTTFCGPAAIAALTRAPVVKVEDEILAHRKACKPPHRNRLPPGCRVKTMWGTEVSCVLGRLGFSGRLVVNPTFRSQCLTLARQLLWLRANGYGDKPLLVLVSGHFIALHGSQFVDTNNTTPRDLRGHRFMRKRVVRVWAVEEF